VLVTSNLFEVLGVPLLYGGKWPAAADRGRSFEVVPTHDLWRRKFGGDPGVLGRKITLDAAPFYTIHGVLPPDVKFPNNVELFRSIAINERLPNYKQRGARQVYALARLKDGVTIEQAQAEVRNFGARLAHEHPATNAGLGFVATPLVDFYVGDVRPYLWLLAGAVGFVLLIACANVTNLLLGRALGRDLALAVRAALGAGWGRLVRLLLAESLLLALASGLLGLALAWAWGKLLAGFIGVELPPWMAVGLDARVLLFTFVVSVLTGVLAGLAPVLRAAKPNLNELLKEATRGSSGGTQHGLRRALVVAEIALALLAGAGLMARSSLRLQQVELGFNPEWLLTLRVALPWRKFSARVGLANEGRRLVLFRTQDAAEQTHNANPRFHHPPTQRTSPQAS
jgi:putative ABC transport system permease protein